MCEKKEEFQISRHEGLIENLNRISDDLLQAKWWFLGVIAALGVAYTETLKVEWIALRTYGIIIVSLIGNISFWFLSEYTLSHAFLYRFVQSQAAKIEKEFKLDILIKDPSDRSYFLKKDNGTERLSLEFLIPDQFVPIYWASFWLMIINTATAFVIHMKTYQASQVLQGPIDYNVFQWISIYLLTGIPFMWKLWTYYLYKIDKFAMESSKLNFVSTIDKERFFRFPLRWSIGPMLIFAGICLAIGYYADENLLWLSFLGAIVGYFWPVLFGLFVHLYRIFLRIEHKSSSNIIHPVVESSESNQLVSLKYKWQEILCLLNVMV